MRYIGLENSNFKDTYLKGSFTIKCSEINITSNDEHIIFTNSGVISISPINGVEVEIIVNIKNIKKINSIFLQSIHGFNDPNRNKNESDFYEINAVDFDRNIWKSDKAIPFINKVGDSIHIYFRSTRIESTQQYHLNENYIHHIFAEPLHLPFGRLHPHVNRLDAHTKSSDKLQIISGELDEMEIRFFNFPNYFESAAKEFMLIDKNKKHDLLKINEHIIKSIRFCTAINAAPVGTEISFENHKIIQLSSAAPQNKGFFPPPIFYCHEENNFFDLLRKYFEFSCNCSSSDFNYHNLEILYSLKNVSLEVAALISSVSVEKILNSDFFKANYILNDDLITKTKLVESTIKSLEEYAHNKPIFDRIINILGNARKPKIADKLRYLCDIKLLSDDEFKSFKSIRNSAAHGDLQIGDESKELKIIRGLDNLISLIYKISLYRIGYRGKFTDYSTPERKLIELNVLQ